MLFNRFYQPDIDLEHLEVVPDVRLSSAHDLRLPLRWIAILYGQVKADLAATSGIHTAEDVVKTVLVGADAAMMASALLREGIGHLWQMRSDLESWLEEREYESVAQMKGSVSQKSCPDPSAFERANYMRALNTYRVEGGAP